MPLKSLPENLPSTEQLIQTLADRLRPDVGPDTVLVGIHTGGVWLAERLHQLLGLSQPLGSIDASYHRDDFSRTGLRPGMKASHLPFEVEGANVIIVDDVLYTGRTIRAALNELFDFGRPKRVDVAALIDRGCRELPIYARYCAHTLDAPLLPGENLVLARDEAGKLSLSLMAD